MYTLHPETVFSDTGKGEEPCETLTNVPPLCCACVRVYDSQKQGCCVVSLWLLATWLMCSSHLRL